MSPATHRSRPPADAWRIHDIGAHFGIKPGTVRSYRARGQMPAADGQDQYGPWWHAATITTWTRPGSGNRTPRTQKDRPDT